jgi:hypothetical protein
MNFGLLGIGNQRIFWRMNECLVKDLVGIDDKIITVWSSWHREDRLLETGWTWGNIFNSNCYSDHYIDNYWNEDFDIIKNLNAITAANSLCDIAHNGTMLHIGEKERYDGSNVPELLDYKKKLDNYRHYVDKLPNLVGFNRNGCFSGIAYDKHPDILCHLDYYDRVRKSLPFLKEADLGLANELQHTITATITKDLKHKELYKVMLDAVESVVPGYREQIGLSGWKFKDPIDLVC